MLNLPGVFEYFAPATTIAISSGLRLKPQGLPPRYGRLDQVSHPPDRRARRRFNSCRHARESHCPNGQSHRCALVAPRGTGICHRIRKRHTGRACREVRQREVQSCAGFSGVSDEGNYARTMLAARIRSDALRGYSHQWAEPVRAENGRRIRRNPYRVSRLIRWVGQSRIGI